MQIRKEIISGKEAAVISDIGRFSLADTLECGQCFRHICLSRGDSVEYLTVVGDEVFHIAERREGELIVFSPIDKLELVIDYFALSLDYDKINAELKNGIDNDFFKSAADAAGGIRILNQEPWETLFSFIVSQNNNIPRIKGIIRRLCAAYGEPLIDKSGLDFCPRRRALGEANTDICRGECKACGICYTFPSAEAVLASPEAISLARVGFRYGYLLDAAKRVHSGDINLDTLRNGADYAASVRELKRIYGVGDKVASCVALFSLGSLDAFPVDVWMKRAIDEHFDGSLDPAVFGKYAGIAQQYIFHYKRILEEKN